MLMTTNLIGFMAKRRGGNTIDFTMTAGDDGSLQGYHDGSGSPAFGSIDGEPIPGFNLATLASGFLTFITFHGDATSILAGLTVRVDGVAYPFDFQDWTYDSGDNATSGIWDVAGPVFVNTVVYFVEIK